MNENSKEMWLSGHNGSEDVWGNWNCYNHCYKCEEEKGLLCPDCGCASWEQHQDGCTHDWDETCPVCGENYKKDGREYTTSNALTVCSEICYDREEYRLEWHRRHPVNEDTAQCEACVNTSCETCREQSRNEILAEKAGY